jgi:hypothetical protein
MLIVVSTLKAPAGITTCTPSECVTVPPAGPMTLDTALGALAAGAGAAVSLLLQPATSANIMTRAAALIPIDL